MFDGLLYSQAKPKIKWKIGGRIRLRKTSEDFRPLEACYDVVRRAFFGFILFLSKLHRFNTKFSIQPVDIGVALWTGRFEEGRRTVSCLLAGTAVEAPVGAERLLVLGRIVVVEAVVASS
jgi:hypothetical protein